MKRNDRFFSRSRKNEPPVTEGAPMIPEAPVAETVVVGHALLFAGAPEPMPIVDEQLYLSIPPQGGLVISPQCVGAPMLVIWKSGEDWLVRRLCRERLLCNGFETPDDSPILLWDGICLELVGVSAFTFLALRGPVTKEPAVQEAPVAEEPAPEEAPPFDWTPFLPMDDEEPVPQAEPETAEELIPVTEPEVTEEPVPAEEPEVTEEPVPLEEPEVTEEPVPVEAPEAPALSYPATPREALVLTMEQLAAGDREAIQTLPGLLEQVDLYCWGGFNFLGVYLQPIPAVRPADWSGDADTLDQLGWEPHPGMVIPVFTCEEEAVKRSCPLGAFPSCSAAGLFARFAEMGLDLELDPFGERPVWVPAGAVRALSEALGGGPEKFRWIRRTLPW